jgi:hypothetical protein
MQSVGGALPPLTQAQACGLIVKHNHAVLKMNVIIATFALVGN